MLILHDVCWPYGRRDLYYDPSQIPPESRQPYARRGFRPGRKELLPRGGMNITLDNALVEGGPRNGVMTALEDFVAEHDRPLRTLVIPIYFGLAIVVEERVLDARPGLRDILDEFESATGRQRLLELSEQIRLEGTVFEHNIMRVRDEQVARARDDYLALLRAVLLDQPYLENEVRIEYLLKRAGEQQAVSADLLRAPASFMRKELSRLEQARQVGRTADGDDPTAFFPFTAMGAVKLAQLDDALRAIRDEGIAGDLLECWPGRGGGGVYLRGFLHANEIVDREVWIAGDFRSTSAQAGERALHEGGVDDLLADLNHVRDGFARFSLLDARVRFLQGSIADALADAPITKIALLRIGAGARSDAATALELMYDRISDGGFIVIEDFEQQECRDAITDFRERHGISSPIERVGWSGSFWRKEAGTAAIGSAEVREDTGRDRAPLAPPAPTDAVDLSVIVVFFNMRREAARTLHSLSRSYQRGIADLTYEVIAVENGSADSQRLDEDFVRSFGPEFRYLDIGAEATPSPTVALNRAIKLARGKTFALMIDGAHLLTPGVLRFGMAGLRCYSPAIVATQQWYVGPGQQPIVVEQGYDRDREDDLFRSIDWPSDGYRLFEISHFIGDRDWFDGVLESNCLFVPRALLEQVGGFDDSFSMPGGGYVNLDLWERLGSSPDVTVVSILGEGSFHQVHGGTTTNDAAHDDRRSKIFAYGEHYEELRGRLLRGPAKPLHYVGALAVEGARRTRSRRMMASAFVTGRTKNGPDGVPASPEPFADESKASMIETYWRGLSWQGSEWLGRPVAAPPTDLFVYQELVAKLRPDWIVETGTAGGGRATFLASVCDLIGHGQVISVGDDNDPRPEHPRIHYIQVRPDSDDAMARIRELTGADPHALVILGSRTGAPRLIAEFTALAPLVPVGSYVIVENTIVNGHPVWPGYGPGPTEAVRRILALHGNFAPDTSCEKHGLTFNPGGFLRRIG